MTRLAIASRHALWAAAFCIAAAVAPQARADITYSFNFDAVASGTNANHAIGGAFPAVSFAYGQYVPRLDTFGDPIPGSDHWEAYEAPDDRVNVVDAAPYGRGTTNKLDGLTGPVLLKFSAPVTLSAFSMKLDDSTFGNLGTQYLLFLDAAGDVLGQYGFTQYGQAGTTVSYAGVIANASAVLLPSGKLYDDLSVSAVPLPLPLALFPAGAFIFGVVSRRRKSA
ncbi:hypothetical protein [Methylibium sp.]|uniref:hypothetical protein n=1 Tax=Methylibium sp. TaxID=2067992 RepID=UPI003D10A128